MKLAQGIALTNPSQLLERILLSIAIALAVSRFAAADGPGVEITSRIGTTRLVTVYSAEGVISTQYGDGATQPAPLRGVILRYSDRALWGIDFRGHTCIATTLTAQDERRQSMRIQAIKATPPGRPNDPPRVRAPGVLERLPATDHIGTFALRAYRFKDSEREWRLWYAATARSTPSALVTEVARNIPVDSRSRNNLKDIVSHPLVRVELRSANDWKVVLSTDAIRQVQVKTTDFAPPPSFTITSTASDVSVLGGQGGYDLSATAKPGPGPVMAHPELVVVFWGQPFAQGYASAPGMEAILAGLNSAVDFRYIKYLSQYGVESAAISNVYYDSSVPSRDVGASNFAAIDALVYTVGFRENAPRFWWAVGGHDPLYAIFVNENALDNSRWTGYHFLAYTLTDLLMPWPFSLFAHDGMPWVVVKVPDAALSLPVEGSWQRASCDVPTPLNATLCASIHAVDETTTRFSHELVEAATDPYPFSAWIDPDKTPVWLSGEISDICEGDPRPWGDRTLVGDSMVSTYWSNNEKGCVPESRPSIKVIDPVAGAVLPGLAGTLVLRGWADDPIYGPIPEQIMWQVDGTAVGRGAWVNVSGLPLGPHMIGATIQETQEHHKVFAHVDESVTLAAAAPQVVIYKPTDGASYGSDELVVFRGAAMDALGALAPAAMAWTANGVDVGAGTQFTARLQPAGDRLVQLVGKNAAGQTSAAITIHITPPTGKPSVQISQPSNNAGFERGEQIAFAVEVTDGNGAAVPATIRWVSDPDGLLDTQAKFSRILSSPSPCGASTRTITVSATNPAGLTATDSIVITVGKIC